MALIDEQMYLGADAEHDYEVGIHCRICDRGGLPIACYTQQPGSQAYAGTDVEMVTTITALVRAGSKHGVTHT